MGDVHTKIDANGGTSQPARTAEGLTSGSAGCPENEILRKVGAYLAYKLVGVWEGAAKLDFKRSSGLTYCNDVMPFALFV